jgi:hypothetical protein
VQTGEHGRLCYPPWWFSAFRFTVAETRRLVHALRLPTVLRVEKRGSLPSDLVLATTLYRFPSL